MFEPVQARPTRRNLTLSLVASAFPCPAIAQAPAQLMVGTANSSSDVEVFLAQKKGWFADERINVKTISFASAANMVAPLSAGQLDIGGGAISAGMYNAFARGIKLRAVADKASSQPGYPVNRCLVAKRHFDSGRYKTLADLKGMKIGNNGIGNSGWGSIWGALRLAGLTFDDVQIVQLAYPDHIFALENKSLDATCVTEPTATVAVMNGLAVEVVSDDQARPRHALAQILFSERMMADKDLSIRFLRAYLRSVRYYVGAFKNSRLAGPNAEEIISVLTEFTPIKDPQVFREIVPNGVDPNGRIDIETLREDQQIYRQMGWLESNTTVEDVVDLSLLEATLNSLR